MSLIRTLKIFVLCVLTLFFTSCAINQDTNPSQITGQWINPSATFEQKTITGVLVIALTNNPTDRRVFEDTVSNVFSLHGIPTQPGYLFLPDQAELLVANGGVNLKALLAAAKKAKVSDLLLVRPMGTKTNIVYNPGMTWGPGPFWGPGPGPFWGPDPFWGDPWAIPPSITQQDFIQGSAELMLAKNGTVLYTCSTSTLSGADSQLGTYQKYAYMLFEALVKNGFLIPTTLPNYQVAPATPGFDPQSLVTSPATAAPAR